MTGTVTLSVEIELGWGVHDIGEYGHLSEDGRAEREFLRQLLDVCDETEIPISFDAVGHLFLASCEGSHDGPYPDGWFDADPGTDVAVDPLFYAPDMIENVRTRDTDHELCTHTFSHTPHGTVSTTAADADLDHAQRVHEDILGERTCSLVPPRHMTPPSHVLRSNGIDVVREAANRRASSRLGRAKELLLGPPPMGDPTIEDGVCRTLSTTYPNLAAASLPPESAQQSHCSGQSRRGSDSGSTASISSGRRCTPSSGTRISTSGVTCTTSQTTHSSRRSQAISAPSNGCGIAAASISQ
ncbi:polysaccharide deacetylase family protein [Natronoarchaeum sp. GCM10025703]|uniref:polysaccharide deacetylase family protein n=1 Tax=Natronoarchaeum sp. GCM10025703 TaxID=3252685 RepID=UPI00360951CD